MTDRPTGSVQSGEFAYELWTTGSVCLYQYVGGRRALRYQIRMDENDKYWCTPIGGGEEKSFDFAGFLHVMNSQSWLCVVFTNYWFAHAYEQKLKQERK